MRPPKPSSPTDPPADGRPPPSQNYAQRRSTRLTRRPTPFGPNRPELSQPCPSASSGTRRNPKRKASKPASPGVDLPRHLLEEALKPLASREADEWEGWVELESEPAFFNFILSHLGVQHVKAQEIFSIDPGSLGFLPKPVYGLIFLFQFLPSDDDPVAEEDVPDLWFANQTTSNACATVALLNIVMNADVGLGERLQDFKERTKDLHSALRGHFLSANQFISTIHNSFARRMDHLNADLWLENEASSAASSRSRRSTAPKKARGISKKNKGHIEYGFHFIAYVPKNGRVWELDGLRAKPRPIAETGPEDWTSRARSHIAARMSQDDEAHLSFNLIALCQSPLASHARAIARAIASIRYLRTTLLGKTGAANHTITASDEPRLLMDPDDDASLLSEFNLSARDVCEAKVPQSLKDAASRAKEDAQAARGLYMGLVADANALMGEYRAEFQAVAEEEQCVQGRKEDYAPALHCWVKTLAEKGVLEEIIRSS